MSLPTEQHFILKEDGKIYWIERMPDKPKDIKCDTELGNLSPCVCAANAFDHKANRDIVDHYDDNCPHRYKSALQSAIDSAVEVSNQEEVLTTIWDMAATGKVYSLLCSVEKELKPKFPGASVRKYFALVTFSQPEKETQEELVRTLIDMAFNRGFTAKMLTERFTITRKK